MKTNAAGVFLINRQGYLLVCHPTNHKPDFWSIPKGKIEDGESMVVAAIRETFEETNIDLSTSFCLRPLEAVTYKSKKKTLHPFVLLESESQTINWKEFDLKCNSFVAPDRGGFPEMDDYKWVTLDEARPLLHETQAACIDVLKALYETHGRN